MLTVSEIRGIIPAAVTAFTSDEALDEDATAAHVERLLEAGVHGVFSLGTNGEFFVLSPEEKVRVLQRVVRTVDHRVPVYAGAGAISTRDTVELAKRLAGEGADVLSVITPYFAQASQDDLVAHFTAVADAVEVPVLLYNIPARTGNAIAPATVARLSQHDRIHGVKDSSGNFDTLLQYLEQTDRERFTVLSGNDSLILWALLAGGSGGISGIANIYPRTLVAIYERWAAGDLAGARTAQDSIRTIRTMFKHGNPNTVVKAATNLAGSPVGPCRAPFHQLPPAGLEEIAQVVAADHARGLA